MLLPMRRPVQRASDGGRPSPVSCAIAALLALGAAVTTVHAGWVAGPRLTTFPSVVAGERFGYCNATNGDYLAVGAPDANGPFGHAGVGAVYLFKRTDEAWEPLTKLQPPNDIFVNPGFAQFGSSVAMSRDTLVVGAWGYGTSTGQAFAGAAFVFTRSGDTWSHAATLRASDAALIDQFGWSVSVDMPEAGPGVIAVGKVLDGPQNTGAVYVFEGSGATWTQVAKLTPADLAANDQFGYAVSVRGTTLVGTSQRHNGTGAAYVFERSGAAWVQVAKLNPGDLTANDAFGASASAGDGFIVVGAPGKSVGGSPGVGRAYVFEGAGATWTPVALAQRQPFQNDAFGYSVAAQRPDAPLDPGTEPFVLVGAPGYEAGAANNGAAFAFRKVAGVWTIDDSDLFVSTAPAQSALGRSVSLSPDGLRACLSSETPSAAGGSAHPFLRSDDGGGESPGSGGTPGGGSGDPIIGGGVPPSPDDAIDRPGGGGGGGGAAGPGTPTPLGALEAEFGTVVGTFIMVDAMTRTIYAMQSDGVLENVKPKVEVITQYPESFELLACPDLNGDGSGDLLFLDRSTGMLHGWHRDGLEIISEVAIEEAPEAFDFASFGDFNGDAIDDLVFRNGWNGNLRVWLMSASGELFREATVELFDNHWRPKQVDITGDGRPELMLRQRESGELLQLEFDANGTTETLVRWPDAASDYDLVAGGDFDGDGNPDLVWNNESQGQFEVWFMNPDRTDRSRMRLMLDAESWRIESLRDFDGNGFADFLLSRNESGRLVAVYMEFTENGPRIIRSRGFGRIDQDLDILGFAPR